VQANSNFQKQPKPFWALVKLVSEGLGYSVRGSRGSPPALKRYSVAQVQTFLTERGLDADAIAAKRWDALLVDYVAFRADLLEQVVEPVLMDGATAAAEYTRIHTSRASWNCHFPMNKQSGNMAHVNYLSAMVNMLAEQARGSVDFNDNPGGLITVTRDNIPVRTLARRLDGAYPGINDPAAVWEVKEYYGTTTFGSRVADGIYETQLDGTELVELREVEGIAIKHYLMVDDRFTWWIKGRSYLCRIIDMLHDDLIDEVFFGRQVITDWPAVAASW